jgi:hypothetical protein
VFFKKKPVEAEFTLVEGEQLFVGESRHAEALHDLLDGRYPYAPFTARLVPERNNPHDSNAVRVEIDGHTVAHLSRANAIAYRLAAGSKIAELPVIIYARDPESYPSVQLPDWTK